MRFFLVINSFPSTHKRKQHLKCDLVQISEQKNKIFFIFIKLYIKMRFSLFFDFNLYLKLYFYILLDFNAFKFVFLDFYNTRQVVFFRYDGSIVLTTNRSN